VTPDVPAPDTERRIQRGHQARTAPRVPAWLALLIGLGLIAAGTALVLVGAGGLRPAPRVPVPAAVLSAIGVVFVVPIELSLPRGPYETRLADRPPRYWELEVRGEATGADFGATFLLPVYAPAASVCDGTGLPA
jgi:hypothetical protein